MCVGLDKYKKENSRYTSFTLSDNNKLQVLQNKMNRLLTGADRYTSTAELLERTNSISIQQMIAFQTLVMTYKIVKTKKPTYLSNKLKENTNQIVLRGGSQSLSHPNQSLSISKEGFINSSGRSHILTSHDWGSFAISLRITASS